MANPLSELEAENRPRWTSSLLRCFPEKHDAIERGWELVDTYQTEEPSPKVIGRFMHREVAIIGDSHLGVRFGPRDGDFNSGGAYFRVAIYPGDPPPQPQCVHYEVCVLGTVAAVLWPFRIAALVVAADRYIINQTF